MEIDPKATIDVGLRTRVVDCQGSRRLEGLILEDAATGARSQVPAAVVVVLIFPAR